MAADDHKALLELLGSMCKNFSTTKFSPSKIIHQTHGASGQKRRKFSLGENFVLYGSIPTTASACILSARPDHEYRISD